ncbi:MAG: cyanophycinase [Pseudomonadota bacterium]|nr:cyanophycinase [Pseudomonadota bacterium]QKK04454.1 MAG: cyanophycinase [Pseudomonadota bacterium]
MTLIAIGGAEDKQNKAVVLRAVLNAAKDSASRVHVITTATNYPDDVAKTYRDAFARLGVKNCEISHIETAAEAGEQSFLDSIDHADIVFFSGGDQSKLARILKDTPFTDKLQERREKDLIIAGTSAGAAVMSACMVTGGTPEDARRKGGIKTGDGFGFAEDIIFDTHFMNRGRLPRLFNLVAADPSKTGIGLDEDTAVILHKDGKIEVIGSGSVTIVTKSPDATSTDQSFTPADFDVKTLRHGARHRL